MVTLASDGGEIAARGPAAWSGPGLALDGRLRVVGLLEGQDGVGVEGRGEVRRPALVSGLLLGRASSGGTGLPGAGRGEVEHELVGGQVAGGRWVSGRRTALMAMVAAMPTARVTAPSAAPERAW